MVDVVTRVAEVLTIPFTVGGGIRSVDDARRIIEAGADRVSLNSAALARPELIGDVAELFGSQAVVVAIDTSEGAVFSHGGRQRTSRLTDAWALEAAERGAAKFFSPRLITTAVETAST